MLDRHALELLLMLELLFELLLLKLLLDWFSNTLLLLELLLFELLLDRFSNTLLLLEPLPLERLLKLLKLLELLLFSGITPPHSWLISDPLYPTPRPSPWSSSTQGFLSPGPMSFS